MTYLIIVAFLLIVGSLGAALIFMMRGSERTHDPRNPNQLPHDAPTSPPNRGMARALAWRVGLSILLFVVVLFSAWMGWIQPTGIAPGR